MVAVDNKCLLLVAFMVLMYFAWMDITLWYRLQALVPTEKGKTPQSSGFTVFAPITVKLLMSDPFNHYIYLPLCYAFTQVTHFAELFSFVTPNMISLARVAMVVPALRLLLSDSLCVRQTAIGVILLGETMDALDGYVARMRQANPAMRSEVGKLGYYMDGICDGVSVIMILLVCIVVLRRHPPRQNGAPLLPLQLPIIGTKADSRQSEIKESLLGGGCSSGGGGGSSCGNGSRQQVSGRTISASVVLFGFQLLVASIGWNRVIAGYQRLLENSDGSHTAKQLMALQAASTWILMWFWRILCFHSICHCFLIAIFFDKLWEFLVTMRYAGYLALFTLIALNELHMHAIKSFF